MSDKPSIDVERRRKADQPRRRAAAPRRQRPSGPGGGSSGGGGIGPAGGGGLSGGGGGLPIPTGRLGGCGGAVVLILLVAYYLLSGGLGGGSQETLPDPQQQPSENLPQAQTFPTSTPRPTRTPAPAAPGGQPSDGTRWLVMLYQDADDQVLEQDIFVDLNEAERVGSSEQVRMVTQIDRFRGGFQGDGDWNTTRRYLLTQDDDLAQINSELLEEGESNMADGATLVDFATWAINTYPADHYVLILSDHGMGWPGGWSDPTAGSPDPGRAPLVSALEGDHLYLAEIDQALEQIRQQTGLDRFEVIGMDACLMSQLEVYSALQPHARYAVASEETEPALGWAYTAFLQALVDNPEMSGEDLVASVVESYIDDDQRIVDRQARADFLRQNSPLGGFFGVSDVSPEQLTRQIVRDTTLSAVDLAALPSLMQAFNTFAYRLQDVDQGAVASARSYAQSYTNVFGKDVPNAYIDLGHFAELTARQANNGALTEAANAVNKAVREMVVAEKHGPGKPGSTGIALYFPNSTMYRSPYTGPQSYNDLAGRFVQASLWDDFLAYHYSDRTFSQDAAEPVAPSAGAPSRAPGAGDIVISDIRASETSLAPGDTVTLSAEISGQNIGYIYLFAGLFDQQSNSIFVADTDFLESPDTRELNGVFYPAWPQAEAFDINFEWDASLFAIVNDGASSLAHFQPREYGASAAEAVYIVDGTYTFADTGEERFARLYFVDGRLTQVFGFNGQDDTGAPWEISPSPGDTFTLLQEWMDLDANGNVTQRVTEPGNTLTFSEDLSMEWEAQFAPAGEYVVGFMVEDLDGNLSQAFTQVTVR